MRFAIDHVEMHDQIVLEGAHASRAGQHAAQQIESLIALNGWAEGAVMASEPILRLQLQIGHRTLRQAIRILQSRRVCRMRRGPGGGLVVAKPSRDEAINGISRYLGTGVEDRELVEAQLELDRVSIRMQAPISRTKISVVSSDIGDLEPGALAMRSSNVAISLFATAIAQTRRLSNGLSEDGAAQDWQSPKYQANTANRATQFADQLAADIERLWKSDTEILLGSEEQLCDKYGISRVVLRQALCILETDGVIGTRRGRGGGIVTHKPHPGRAIDMTVGYLTSDPQWRHDTLSLAHELYEITSRLAAARWSPRDEQRLHICLKEKFDLTDHNAMMMYYRVEWEAMQNRAIEFIARALCAYHTRFLASDYDASEVDIARVRESFDQRILAIARSDLSGARDALEERVRIMQRFSLLRA